MVIDRDVPGVVDASAVPEAVRRDHIHLSLLFAKSGATTSSQRLFAKSAPPRERGLPVGRSSLRRLKSACMIASATSVSAIWRPRQRIANWFRCLIRFSRLRGSLVDPRECFLRMASEPSTTADGLRQFLALWVGLGRGSRSRSHATATMRSSAIFSSLLFLSRLRLIRRTTSFGGIFVFRRRRCSLPTDTGGRPPFGVWPGFVRKCARHRPRVRVPVALGVRPAPVFGPHARLAELVVTSGFRFLGAPAAVRVGIRAIAGNCCSSDRTSTGSLTRSTTLGRRSRAPSNGGSPRERAGGSCAARERPRSRRS